MVDIADDRANDWFEREGPDGKMVRVFDHENFQRSKRQIAARRHAEATASSFLLAPAARLGSLPARRAGDFLWVQRHVLPFGLRPAAAYREARDLEHLLGPGQRVGAILGRCGPCEI